MTEGNHGAINGPIDEALRLGADRRASLLIGAILENQTTVRGAAGLEHRTPDAHTLFEIGSVTKLFTALALAIAVIRGEVQLDQPLTELIPDVQVPTYGDVPIRLQDLATHTAAMPRLPPRFLQHAWQHPKDPYVGFDEPALLEAMSNTRLRRSPGGKSRYSNYGFGVLGFALARSAGTSYEELIRDRICVPLGMPDTAITLTAEQQKRFAVGHTRRGNVATPWSLAALAGAGGLRSTGADLLTFLRAQVDSPAGELGDAIRLTQKERIRVTKRVTVCLGWLSSPLAEGARVLFHNGGTGGFRSILAAVPSRRAAVVALTNTSHSVDELGLKLLRTLCSSQLS